MKMRKAFTLIELLVVMAITAVLLTLIIVPVIQSFGLTRAAQALADAQDKARLVTDRVAREIGNAVSVRDAASTDVVVPDGKGNFLPVRLPYTKLDLIPPAQGTPDPLLAPGVFFDPVSGKIDPTLKRPKGDVNVNGLPGPTIVRYFIGQNRPFKDDDTTPATYNEPYTGLLMARNGDRDNLIVLRRAEVQPFVYRPRKDGKTGSNAWRPNLAFFHSDDDRGDGGEYDTRIIDLDDPKFFLADGKYLQEGKVDDLPGNNRVPDNNKNQRVANWAAASTIQTEISRYDMIRPLLQGSPPQVVKDSTGAVTVVPLIQFRPTRVANQPAAGSAAARPGEAVDGLDRIGPDTFRTDRGLWTDAIVRHYAGDYAPGAGLEIASVDTYGNVTISAGATDAGGLDGLRASPDNYVVFDGTTYERSLALGQPYPFTDACLAAGKTDTMVPLGYPGTEWYKVAAQRQEFTPFRVLTATGKIVTSFPIDQVGDSTKTLPSGVTSNAPYVAITTSLSPSAAGPHADPTNPSNVTLGDPNLYTAPYSPDGASAGNPFEPNRAYNRGFISYPDLQGTLQRFIDLRFVPNADGTPSPLCPLTTTGITGFTTTDPVTGGSLNRVRIVPGSDEVYGPDQNPGPGYGQSIVRYTRATGNPGPNQYRLVYADLPEPTSATTGQVDYSALGLVSANGVSSTEYSAFSPTTYSATNFVSAVIQPRFKAGYLQFDSDPNVPLPYNAARPELSKITVTYRFQFNGPSDTFAVDLDTREIMQVLLTIKNYPQSTLPNAQTVTLKSTATLRNAHR